VYLYPWKVQFTVLLHSQKFNTVQINNMDKKTQNHFGGILLHVV